MLQACDMNRFGELMRSELGKDGALTLAIVLRRVLDRLEQRSGADLDELAEAAVNAYVEEVRPADGADRMLARLYAKGVPMALVSNGAVDMQKAALRRLGFERYFRCVLISGDRDVAARKPGPRIFSLACAALETPAHEVVMVGDSLDADVAGALEFGMEAIFVGPDEIAAAHGVPAVGGIGPLDMLLQDRYGL